MILLRSYNDYFSKKIYIFILINLHYKRNIDSIFMQLKMNI